jgi:hypothetical protein
MGMEPWTEMMEQSVSPNFKRCITPDDLTKSRSRSVNAKISENRMASLKGEN